MSTVLSWPLVVALSPSIFLLILCGPQFFFRPKFRLHRLGGLMFLVQYACAWYLYFTDYEWYKNSILLYSVQMNGCMQTISAIQTFHFLPKSKEDPGYYGDKGAISYSFVKENLFYQLLTLFGFFYYNDYGYNILSNTMLGNIFEAVVVFFAFVVIRPLFPKTHFRDALNNSEKNKSTKNYNFYYIGTYIIKLFYIAAKHYMGFFIQYVCFINGFSESDKELLNWMLLANAGTVSISLFLHTLRFKQILEPRIAYSIYVILAYTPFYGFLKLSHIFVEHWLVLILTTIGLLVNVLLPKKWEAIFQSIMCGGFFAYRYGLLSY